MINKFLTSMSYNKCLGSGAPRSFLSTSFLHRCLIITSWAQVSPDVSYDLVSYIDVEVSYKLVSYIDVL